jgi:TetR/AcrR family fatty acid metabolism transcriptional regulator
MKSRNGEKYFRIINAATKIFARKGFFQAKVSDIAREAQVADGTIYLYFDNKDDILISLFEEQMKAVLENMIEQISVEKDAVKKIEKFALTHLKLIELNKNMAEIIQVELRQSGKFMKEYKNEKFLQYLNLISEIIKDGQDQGIFRISSRILRRERFSVPLMKCRDSGYCQATKSMISRPLQNRSVSIFCAD